MFGSNNNSILNLIVDNLATFQGYSTHVTPFFTQELYFRTFSSTNTLEANDTNAVHTLLNNNTKLVHFVRKSLAEENIKVKGLNLYSVNDHDFQEVVQHLTLIKKLSSADKIYIIIPERMTMLLTHQMHDIFAREMFEIPGLRRHELPYGLRPLGSDAVIYDKSTDSLTKIQLKTSFFKEASVFRQYKWMRYYSLMNDKLYVNVLNSDAYNKQIELFKGLDKIKFDALIKKNPKTTVPSEIINYELYKSFFEITNDLLESVKDKNLYNFAKANQYQVTNDLLTMVYEKYEKESIQAIKDFIKLYKEINSKK